MSVRRYDLTLFVTPFHIILVRENQNEPGASFHGAVSAEPRQWRWNPRPGVCDDLDTRYVDRASARRSHPTLSAGPVYKRDVDSGADRSRPGLLLWLDRPTPLSGMCTMLLRLRKCRSVRRVARVVSIPVFLGIEVTLETRRVASVYFRILICGPCKCKAMTPYPICWPGPYLCL